MVDRATYTSKQEALKYTDPLQLAELFYKNRLDHMLYNAFVDVVNFQIDEEKKDGLAFPMMFLASQYEALNLEYNLFVLALSKNFEAQTQRAFVLDFSIREGVRDRMKYPLFLKHLLEDYIGLVVGSRPYLSKGSNAIVVNNFYRPMVYQRIDGGEARQMSAITIKLSNLYEHINSVSTADSLMEKMGYFYNQYIDYEQVAFGIKQCQDYWRNKKQYKMIMLKI